MDSFVILPQLGHARHENAASVPLMGASHELSDSEPKQNLKPPQLS
jgi:hypothetical protein